MSIHAECPVCKKKVAANYEHGDSSTKRFIIGPHSKDMKASEAETLSKSEYVTQSRKKCDGVGMQVVRPIIDYA